MKRKVRAIAVSRNRNLVALNPLLRKGHAHDKSGKAERKQAKDRLHKDVEDYLQTVMPMAA